MEHEEEIQKLLRLKRYEQPPPGYFDDFLHEFQCRQRAEIIHRPLWAVVWDRFSSIAPSFHVPQMAYASIVALALVASAVILARPGSGPSVVASAGAQAFSLSPSNPVTIGETIPVAFTPTGSPSVHYVLPNRPVSYAPSRSF